MEENNPVTQAPLSDPSVETPPPVNPIPEPVVPPIETPQQAPTPETPIVPPQGPKSNIILWIALILLVLSALGAGAYYVVSSGLLNPKPVSSPTPIVSATPTPTADPTADWKIYTNEQAGYSLKYPGTWQFQADSEGCGPVFFYPNTIKIWLTICGLHINQGDTPEEMANRSANSSSAKLESREQVLIDGHSGIKQLVKTGDTQLAIETYVGDVVGIIKFADGQTRKDTGTLAIYYYIQDLDKLPEAKSSLNQILSTFKFLEATPSPTSSASP